MSQATMMSSVPAIALALLPLLQDAPPTGANDDAPVLGPDVPIRLGDDAANAWTRPFFEGATYDPAVARPEDMLGAPPGSRIAGHGEMLAMLRAIEATSDRVALRPYGRTHEGRELLAAIITSPANHARLGAIQEGAKRLRDARVTDAELDGLLGGLPAIAWMGYGIHGDETSASEAAVPFAYHLAAAQGEAMESILDEVVVVLDPCLNPDGRERIRSMVVQGAGYRVNLDGGAMQRGRWPGGRGNHFLFDMNRDWMAGEAPETRARWGILAEFPPQLFVDAHEMSGLDTFLFYPQAAPRNANLPERLGHWQSVLAADAARAFDGFGWGYYTREWADALYPGYSDAWGSLGGAIGMLYEQGRTIGAPLRRESGEVVAYRESVHGQLVASMANLATFARNRREIQRDYLAHRTAAANGAPGTFLVRPSGDVERDARFLRALTLQGIEVRRATEPFEAREVVGLLGDASEREELPAGTLLIQAAQPAGALVRAYLDLDPRLSQDFLVKERRAIERGQGSRIYDVTAWNLARQYGVDGAWAAEVTPASEVVTELTAPRGLRGGSGAPPYAWAADGGDTRSARFAARAMELGLQVHVSDRDFVASGAGAGALDFTRGSFLIRSHENDELEVAGLVARAVRESGALVHVLDSGRSADEEGPDLGGGHFDLLEQPKVAILSNDPVSPTDFGHLWRAIDVELGIPATQLDAQGWRRLDLDRYNVLVIPPGAGAFLRERGEGLARWVEAGGTLIAVGSSAHAIARESSGLSSNRLRRDVLDDLEAYAWRTARERAADVIEVDPGAVYGAGARGEEDSPASSGDDDEDADEGADDDGPSPEPDALDAWRRRFSPRGVILRGELDPAAWITSGYGEFAQGLPTAPLEIPVPFGGSQVLLSSGRPAVRLAAEDRLRLGGLLWPEARVRIADSAWLTVERRGRGHVVCFASSPVYRGSWRGTMRLFLNAVLLGPGAGS